MQKQEHSRLAWCSAPLTGHSPRCYTRRARTSLAFSQSASRFGLPSALWRLRARPNCKLTLVRPQESKQSPAQKPSALSIVARLGNRRGKPLAFTLRHRPQTAPTNRAHHREADQENYNLAHNTEDGHEPRPRHDIVVRRNERVDGRGSKHKPRPKQADPTTATSATTALASGGR